MIEIINIFITLAIFLIFFSVPINIWSVQKYRKINSDSLFENYSLNFLIHVSVFLIISFLDINYFHYFVLIMIFSTFFNLYHIFQIQNLQRHINFKLIFLFILINLIIYFKLAGDATLSWDGLENWFFKAQNFYFNYNFFDLINIRGIDYYPHLGGFLWGFFWKNSLLNYEYFGRFIYVFLFILSIFSLGDVIKQNFLIKTVFVFLVIILCYDKFLFGGYQDILLFSFLIFVSKYFYQYIIYSKHKHLVQVFISLNLLPWIKNEGYIFVLIFSLSLLFILDKIKHKKVIISLIVLSLILMVLKHLIFYKYLKFNPTHGADLKLQFDLNIIFEFLRQFFLGLIVAIFKYKIWIGIIISFFAIYKSNLRLKNEKLFLKFLTINLILYVAAILFIYFDYIDEPRGIYWWIHTTLDRLIYSISGFFVIVLAMLINSRKFKF